jgi:predicted dehydrogenase
VDDPSSPSRADAFVASVREPTLMDSTPVRFGIVGVGRITQARFAPALRATAHAVLQAAASRDPRRAEALEPRRAYGDYSALLRDPDVEAVYIATHNGLHRDLVIEALGRGKHVLCEKPLGRTAPECEEMVAAAQVAGRHLVEGFMYRHHPQIARARELVRQGVIGELTAVEASFHDYLAGAQDVRLRPEWGGGALLDIGCYCVDVARLFLGNGPREVHAWAAIDPGHGIDTAVRAVLAYESGVHAGLSCSFEGGLHQRVVLIGTGGVLELTEPFVTWLRQPRLTVRIGGSEQVTEFEPVDTFRREIEDLCAAIRGVRPPLLGPEEAVRNARILDRVTAAARGRLVWNGGST